MKNEQDLSKQFHKQFTPLLISPKLLRKYDCGQIDLSYIKNGEIYLVEIKSSALGVYSFYKKQVLRIKRSAMLIESLIGIPVHMKIIAKR